MAGTNNFLQFNPGQLNQANDASYTDSTYRSGGIPSVPAAAPSTIHNKLYYQVSTMVVALAQMLANRDKNVSDASLSDLISILDSLADKATVLALAGGTMTGQIVLPSEPISNLQAACKSYVDKKLALAGGTMSGNLLLARDPVETMEAATKRYVDNIPLIPTGSIFWFPAISAPTGFVKANGSLLSRASYPTLWAYAQTFLTTEVNWAAGFVGYFTAGNGSTTFRIPNLDGRALFGAGGSAILGASGGSSTVTLTANQMPKHTHNVSEGSLNPVHGGGLTSGDDMTTIIAAYSQTSEAGNNEAHDNMPPYVNLLACIKT